MTSEQETVKPVRGASWLTSLRLWVAIACLLLVCTVLLLPLPLGIRASILGVLIFSGVFMLVDAGGKGKIFAALTVALLGLYLLFTAQRGVVLIASGNIAGILLGAGLLLLPAVGAWALVREVIFGARIQRMAQELDAQGKLPEDTLPRSPSGRVDREAASVELENLPMFSKQIRTAGKPGLISRACTSVCGERKHARAAMRKCDFSAPRSWCDPT